MGVGLTVGLLAAFVAAAGWRLGATNRGLFFLVLAAALGIGGRIEGVEEYVLAAVVVGVLLASGPIVLWHRAEIASGALQIELRPSSHEVPVGGSATILVSVTNTGLRTTAPMRLEPPTDAWKLSRPGLRSRIAEESTSRPGGSSGSPSGATRSGRTPGWRRKLARSVRVPALVPGTSAEMSFSIPSSSRGVLTLPSLKLWCLDPFELFAYEMLISTETSIVIVPDSTAPRANVSGVLQPAGRFEWSPPATGESSGGPGFDLAGLRPYVPGDRLRLLHWPTLARTGELIVREFEGSGTDAVTIIMDDRAGPVTDEAFEAIISATAGIGKDAARRGLGVELRTPSGVSIDLHSSPTLSRSLLRILATLDAVAVKQTHARTRSFGYASTHLLEDHGGERHRVVVSTTAAIDTLPEILKRTSMVILV